MNRTHLEMIVNSISEEFGYCTDDKMKRIAKAIRKANRQYRKYILELTEKTGSPL